MAEIAHIRNVGGVLTLIRRFSLDVNGKAKGRVTCADGTLFMPPEVGQESGIDKVVPVETAVDDQSTTGVTNTSVEVTVEAARVLVTTVTTDAIIVPGMVAAECQRRLDLGFDYDFGDARGVHHIGTTDQDMKGWDEVTMAAQAMITAGAGSTAINIVTETGAATVTALEWNAILIAAAQARQPIWQASFALQAMDPIPADYATNETYWA